MTNLLEATNTCLSILRLMRVETMMYQGVIDITEQMNFQLIAEQHGLSEQEYEQLIDTMQAEANRMVDLFFHPNITVAQLIAKAQLRQTEQLQEIQKVSDNPVEFQVYSDTSEMDDTTRLTVGMEAEASKYFIGKNLGLPLGTEIYS